MTAINKYLRKDVHYVTSFAVNPDGLQPPAVTICAVGDNSTGWKNRNSETWHISDNCNTTSFQELNACVKNNTFSLNETVKKLYISHMEDEEGRVINPGVWTSSLQMATFGFCHTLILKEMLASSENIILVLTGSYDIILHDPNFFMLQDGSFFIPQKRLVDPSGKAYKIIVTQTTRINRPPLFECNPDPIYNFNQCVKESLVSKIGCQSAYDGTPLLTNFSLCNTKKDMLAYEKEYKTMFFANMTEITSSFGCLPPCKFLEFTTVGEPAKVNYGVVLFRIAFATTDVQVKEESYMFSFESLVGEVGGALGLFLGFSFLGLFEFFKEIGKKYFHRANT